MDRGPFASEVRPRLLDQVRDVIRLKHYSIRTEQSYIHWIKRFTLFYESMAHEPRIHQPGGLNHVIVAKLAMPHRLTWSDRRSRITPWLRPLPLILRTPRPRRSRLRQSAFSSPGDCPRKPRHRDCPP
jgi:hypothetical protein